MAHLLWLVLDLICYTTTCVLTMFQFTSVVELRDILVPSFILSTIVVAIKWNMIVLPAMRFYDAEIVNDGKTYKVFEKVTDSDAPGLTFAKNSNQNKTIGEARAFAEVTQDLPKT